MRLSRQTLSIQPFEIPAVRGGYGGRSSDSGIVATVFGATGFLGRYLVNRLGRCGSQVILPYRGEDTSYRHMKVMGDLGQIVPLKYDPRNLASIERAVSHSNVVINLIGAQVGTSNFSLDDTNRKIARLIARVSKEHHVPCYVHVSDIRQDINSPSEFARLKAIAEQEVREINPKAIIVRPAPLFGAEDKLTNPYGVLLRYWPNFVPLIRGTNWYLQPVFAGDVAKSIVDAIRGEDNASLTLECVGPARMNHEELCALIARLCQFDERYRTVSVPPRLAERVFRFTDHLPRFRPMWSAEEALMRLGRDACPSGDPNVLVDVGEQTIERNSLLWLRRYREPRPMNQVMGGEDYLHPYESEETGWDQKAKKHP